MLTIYLISGMCLVFHPRGDGECVGQVVREDFIGYFDARIVTFELENEVTFMAFVRVKRRGPFFSSSGRREKLYR